MIIDVFPFLNEHAILEIRLRELWDVVDVFVIVESRRTFSGDPKPLHFADDRRRYKEWASKLSSLVIDLPIEAPDAGIQVPAAWHREYAMRDKAAEWIKNNFQSAAAVVWGDVDEIPRAAAVSGWLDGAKRTTHLEMPMYRYFLNYLSPEPWSYCTLWPASQFRKYPGSTLRQITSAYFLKEAGWHFTSVGGADQVIRKIESFSHHADANVPAMLADYRAGVEPLERDGKDLQRVPIDQTFPKWVQENQALLTEKGLIKP